MLKIEDIAALYEAHREAARQIVQEFSLSDQPFPFNTRPSIMGVINLSPDSWYRESVCLTTDSAIRRARLLRAQGAAIIDLGAESTLGHAARIDEA